MALRVAIFASGRADLWPLSSVVRALAASPARTILIVPSGLGVGLSDLGLEDSDVDLVEIAPFRSLDDSAAALTRSMTAMTEGVSDVLDELRPDLLLVLGDRFELLGVCATATLHRVPIVHLHGGELTEGVIDDAVRHAVTKLSHLHLTATEAYADRVRSMGEEPWRVIVTGEPTIGRLEMDAERVTTDELITLMGAPIVRPFALMTYHAPTLEPERWRDELEAIIVASAGCKTVLVTHPGPDPGAASILARLRRWADDQPGVVLVPSLGRLYPRALAEADVVLGNSSSGIVEAPTFGVPVINVGDRQQGRVRWSGILDVPGEPEAVVGALETALNPVFRARVARDPNPYGDGMGAERVVGAVLGAPLDRLLRKRFCDPGPASCDEILPPTTAIEGPR